MPFGLLLLFFITSNLLTMSIPDEGYSKNASKDWKAK